MASLAPQDHGVQPTLQDPAIAPPNHACPYLVTISIDTSIFDRHALRLGDGLLKELCQFKESPTQVIFSEVVISEVRKHLLEKLGEAQSACRKSVIGWCSLAAQDASPLNDLGLEQDLEEVARTRLTEFLRASNAEIVMARDSVQFDSLISAYFNGDPPFAKAGKKKSEFPDAIALMSLAAWANKNRKDVLLVSSDKDWESFCKSHQRLHHIPDLAEALKCFQSEAAQAYIPHLEDILTNSDDPLTEEIIQQISNGVHELGAYGYADSMFHTDVDFVELELSSATFNEGSLVAVQTQDDRISVKASVSATSMASASVNHFAKDPIDRDYIQMGSSHVQEEFEHEVDVLLHLSGDFTNPNSRPVIDRVEILSDRPEVEFGMTHPDDW